ncbi:MAG: hypothetical protein H8D45_15760 [Bacteroidetes bacterium]|nr:hypothetical protein [Bacteroidota bacterium]MBL7105156.1 hypothetical protein [Bacteroidales bacterium]
MRIKRKYMLFGVIVIFIFVLIIFAILKQVTYINPKLEKIELIGDSQIGLDFTKDGAYFMYTSFRYDEDSTNRSVILNERNKNQEFEGRYFGGFIDDTINIMFGLQDTCFIYRLSNKGFNLFQKLFALTKHESGFGAFKPDVSDNSYGFYYVKDNDLTFFNLKDSVENVILSCDKFGEDYTSITSFDINKEIGIFCLKKEIFNDSYYYDYYTYDFKEGKSIFVYKTPRTEHLTYEPIVKYINDTTALTSFNLDDNNNLLFKIDLIRNKTIATYSLGKKRVVNITSDKASRNYLTLLNERIRDSLSINNDNVDKGIYGGVNIYSFIPLPR